MNKLILSLIAGAYLAGFGAVSLAGVSGHKMPDGMSGKIEASTEAATANKVTMKESMTADAKPTPEAMTTSSLPHVRQTRLHYILPKTLDLTPTETLPHVRQTRLHYSVNEASL